MINTKFVQLNKEDDVTFLKFAWNMEIPELQELLKFLEGKFERAKSLVKVVKGQTKALYKNEVLFYKSRIKFVKNVIHDKKMNLPIPDFAIKKQNAEMIIRRRLAKLTESYAAIVSLPDTNIKEYAKAAIRDIFIQMPSRSITHENWPGFKNYIVGFFGENSYNTAMEELQTEGWLSKGETRYEWKKMYGPVGTIPKKDHLNEWADKIRTGKSVLNYFDYGAYPFVYNIKNYYVKFGEEKDTHYIFTRMKEPIYKADGALSGRIWTNEKILSMWEYPDTKSMYNAMIKKINEEMKKKKLGKIDASWKIDIPNVAYNLKVNFNSKEIKDIKNQQNVRDFRDIESYLIPVFDWTPDIMKNPNEYKKELDVQIQQHVRSPITKKSDVVGQIGSKKQPLNLTNTQRHQIKVTSDSQIKLKKLIESPDICISKEGRLLHYTDDDAFPFYIIDDVAYLSVVPGKDHSQIFRNPNYNKYELEKLINSNKTAYGRIWLNSKILSFWEYPKNKNEMKDVADALSKYFNIDVWNDFDVEIQDIYKNGQLVSKKTIIPVKLFKSSDEPPDKEYQQHLLSPIKKAKKDVPVGWGSKKLAAGLTATQRNHMQSTSENINEWADEVHYKKNGKEILLKTIDKDAIPFVYRLKSKKTYFGNFAECHEDIKTMRIFSKERGSISGRLWTDSKIISLWDYPDTKQQFMDIIDSINKYNKEKITINSSWKMDIPDVAINYYSSENFSSKMYKEYKESYLIPVFDWKPNIMKNPSLYRDVLSKRKELHTLSPMAKNADVYSGVGSKKRTSGFSTVQQYQLAHTSENKINEIQTEYGCLMLKLEFPWWRNFVEKYVKKEDIYNNVKQEFGYEYKPHVTILYGFNENVDVAKIKKILHTLQRPISIKLTKIDIFSTKTFDVVKFDVVSKILNKLNEIMKQNFDYTETYKDYKPHVTIAYVNSGEGQKYISNLKVPIFTSSSTFIYSYPGDRRETFNVLKK